MEKQSYKHSYLRFNVTMKNPVTVHVLDCFQKLVHVVFHTSLWQVVRAAFYGLVKVHLHNLEH